MVSNPLAAESTTTAIVLTYDMILPRAELYYRYRVLSSRTSTSSRGELQSSSRAINRYVRIVLIHSWLLLSRTEDWLKFILLYARVFGPVVDMLVPLRSLLNRPLLSRTPPVPADFRDKIDRSVDQASLSNPF